MASAASDSRGAFERRLDELHARARRSLFLHRFTILTRILIAAGFVPTGWVKMLGERFTTLSPDSPVGFFFEALYRSGMYWRFLGLAQFATGVLLLVPATATLGAVAFFAIVLNIFVITVAMDFRGTPLVTGLMLVASVYLLCWDYARLKGLVFAPAAEPRPVAPSVWRGLEWTGYGLAAAGALVVLGGTRGIVPWRLAPAGFALGLAGGCGFLLAWFLQARAARLS